MSDAEQLRALMEADRWLERVRAQRSHLPELAELAELEARLRVRLGELRDAEADLAPLSARVEESAAETERLARRAHELDAALSASHATARDLAAIQTELTHVRERLSTAEDVELELLEELEPAQARVAAIKSAAQPDVARRAALHEEIAALQSSLDEEIAALGVSREETARVLEPALRRRYENALARAGTSGAELVLEGRCDGCRLRLSPLDVDHFKALAPGTFMDCPECGRILLS